jgi:penicillin-binding protein-related factor A (putative recombinase)
MTESLGKKFEQYFKLNWKNCFPKTFIYRLPDMMGGYAGFAGSNPCDFICFPEAGKLFMLELKEHKGNTIAWTAIRQYEKLLTYANLKHVFPGIIIWFSDHDKIIYCPIEEAKKMHDDGLKSINIKMLDEKLYNVIEIPTVKKRVFLEADYTVLLKLEER